MKVKFKNARDIQHGIEFTVRLFVNHAKMASQEARRYKAMNAAGSHWALEEMYAHRHERHRWMRAAKALLSNTTIGLVHDTCRERRMERFHEAARAREAA